MSAGLAASACGSGDDIETRSVDGGAPTPGVLSAEVERVLLECRPGVGSAHLSSTYASDAAGFPTVEDALESEIARNMPSSPTAVPDRISDDVESARSADGFHLTARGDRVASVSLRHEGRVVAGFSVAQLPSGGWVVDSFSMCGDLDKIDLESLATHEFGHAYGWVGHVADSDSGLCPTGVLRHTMCRSLEMGSRYQRTPSTHDLHTMDAAYP